MEAKIIEHAKDKLGFARTFSITSFLLCGPRQMNKDLLSVMVLASLLISRSSITYFITGRA